MKQTAITALLALVAMTAQEKLIHIDSEDIAWQKVLQQTLKQFRT